MTSPTRWTEPLPALAAACRLRLPWERGLRRAALARRLAAATDRRANHRQSRLAAAAGDSPRGPARTRIG